MRHARIATFAPLALLAASTAHADPAAMPLRPLCTADLPARCQPLAEVPASSTTPGPQFAARISVANCVAMESMSKLDLKPDALSIHTLDTAAQQSLALLDEVILKGDAHYREVARAARADLLNGMVVRIRTVANDPKDKNGIEHRLALWTKAAESTIAMGPSCPAPEQRIAS